jgi:hypothetical protein
MRGSKSLARVDKSAIFARQALLSNSGWNLVASTVIEKSTATCANMVSGLVSIEFTG